MANVANQSGNLVDFGAVLAAIENALDRALPQGAAVVAPLHEAMRYGVLPGGKRIRPLLVLSVCEALGGALGDALPAATALELLHCYTLIHDDLPCMDNDAMRRGQPTCHVKYGEALALLAGDALLTLAFEQAANSPRAAAEIVHLLAVSAGGQGVIAGQVADLAALEEADVSGEMLTYIHTNKTAALFRCAALMGVYAAGRDQDADLYARFGRFGLSLGLAFQYVDDLLDEGEDAAFSSVSVLGLEEVRRRAEQHTVEALAVLDMLGEAGEALRVLSEMMLKRES